MPTWSADSPAALPSLAQMVVLYKLDCDPSISPADSPAASPSLPQMVVSYKLDCDPFSSDQSFSIQGHGASLLHKASVVTE
jgi:hypothetical protein